MAKIRIMKQWSKKGTPSQSTTYVVKLDDVAK